MLIDGTLVETQRAFPSVNPATGEVMGYAPEGTVADAEAAAAAARKAFDTSRWATDVDLRIHCLEQFHQVIGAQCLGGVNAGELFSSCIGYGVPADGCRGMHNCPNRPVRTANFSENGCQRLPVGYIDGYGCRDHPACL